MKKIILIIIGIIVVIAGLLQSVKYAFHYNRLTNYGKGYVIGSILLIIIGIILLFAGCKKK